MRILEYEFKSPTWAFETIQFNEEINLIVGDSGSGKTRLLNTIFNLGSSVTKKINIVDDGQWKLLIGINEDRYQWNISFTKDENETFCVDRELLLLNDEKIIDREKGDIWFCDSNLPKLSTNEMSVSLLREEPLIKPLFDGFSKILRRKFFEDALGKNSGIYAVNQKFLKRIGQKKDLFELFKLDIGLNPRLYIIYKYFPDIYTKIITTFTEIFSFISEVRILDSSDFDQINIPGKAPIFCMKENNVDVWIRLDELSSGMQKILLILTDLFSMPKDSIYLLDEYENSLGIGSINFLPNLLLSEKFDTQLILTSHHPYIINNIPIQYWYIAHRKGSIVQFSYGKELEAKYSISSQEKYIQLLNDPLYSEGIE